MDHLCYLFLAFVILSRLFFAALRSPAGKGLTSWLSFVMLNCDFVTFPSGILGQVCYLICRFLIFVAFRSLIIRVVLAVLCGGLKSIPALLFNALIIPLDCVYNRLPLFLPLDILYVMYRILDH